MARNLENKKRCNRDWYQRVKDTPLHKKKSRDWYLANRARILREKKAKLTAFRLVNPRILRTKEEVALQKKAWKEKNREKANADMRSWRNRNLSKQQEYARKYYNERISLGSQFGRLVASGRERKYEVTVTLKDFCSLVSAPCFYCGESALRRGIDRIDNTLGYTKENSASCCKICNYMKKTMSVPEFIAHIKRIAAHNS